MNLDSLSREILHNIALIKEYRKRLRILELQAAKFGPGYVPSHIEVEANDIKEILQNFDENVQEMTVDLIRKLQQKKQQQENMVNDLLVSVKKLKGTVKMSSPKEEEESYHSRKGNELEIGRLCNEIERLQQEIKEIEKQLPE